MTAETEHPAIIADSADMTEDTATTAGAKPDTLAAGPSETSAKADTKQTGTPAYYTVQETAKLLKVSERTIWRWIHGENGRRLTARKFGRQYRITPAAIDAIGDTERREIDQMVNDDEGDRGGPAED